MVFILVENAMATHSKFIQVIEQENEKDPLSQVIRVQIPLGEFFAEPLHPAIVLFAKYMNINVSFVWIYLDLFIAIISMGLTFQFQLFNAELKRAKNEVFDLCECFIHSSHCMF